MLNLINFFLYLLLGCAKSKIMQEPDYDSLVYGGVWRHVIVNPDANKDDVSQASRAVQQYIQKLYPSISISDAEFHCDTKLELWYTDTSQEPFALEGVSKSNDKHSDNLVSVPLSFGNTYNFHFLCSYENKKFIHYVTVTTSRNFEKHFVYSHTYFSTPDSSSNQIPEYFVKENENVHGVPVLSSLSKSKTLQNTYSCNTESQCDRKYESPDRLSVGEGSAQSQQADQDTVISVMTYNIWNYFTFTGNENSYPGRISRLLKLVNNIQPDIIGFQEIRFETPKGGNLGPSQMDHIVPHLKDYQFVYQPAMMHETCLEQGRTEEGVAIFSRYPIIYHDYILLHRNLSNNADGHQRVCLHAVIEVPDVGSVHVFNTHWSLTHVARERAAAQIVDFMKRYSGPSILLGDLNATPEEKALKILTEDFQLQDAWETLHKGSDGFTFSCLKDVPDKRIDYILYHNKSGLLLNNIEVIPDSTREKAASDHYPVLAKFSCTSKNPVKK